MSARLVDAIRELAGILASRGIDANWQSAVRAAMNLRCVNLIVLQQAISAIGYDWASEIYEAARLEMREHPQEDIDVEKLPSIDTVNTDQETTDPGGYTVDRLIAELTTRRGQDPDFGHMRVLLAHGLGCGPDGVYAVNPTELRWLVVATNRQDGVSDDDYVLVIR